MHCDSRVAWPCCTPILVLNSSICLPPILPAHSPPLPLSIVLSLFVLSFWCPRPADHNPCLERPWKSCSVYVASMHMNSAHELHMFHTLHSLLAGRDIHVCACVCMRQCSCLSPLVVLHVLTCVCICMCVRVCVASSFVALGLAAAYIVLGGICTWVSAKYLLTVTGGWNATLCKCFVLRSSLSPLSHLPPHPPHLSFSITLIVPLFHPHCLCLSFFLSVPLSVSFSTPPGPNFLPPPPPPSLSLTASLSRAFGLCADVRCTDPYVACYPQNIY